MTTASGKTFLHIGAPKTASTTLQRTVFTMHPEVHYVGEEGEGWPSQEEAALAEKMIFADDLFFPATECARMFDAQRAAAGKRVFIYSNGDIMTTHRSTACAQRLHRMLPGAQIIIVLRNQFTALASYWANHGAFLKPAPPQHFHRFVNFDDWLSWCLMFPPDTPAINFLYSDIIDLYGSLWGRERIHVLLFENFIADPDAFVRNLAQLLGIDEDHAAALAQGGHQRQRNSARRLAWHRFRSRFFWGLDLPSSLPGRDGIKLRWDRFLAAGAPARIDIPTARRSQIIDLYGSGNARLVRDWDLDLACHGYPLPDPS